MQEETTWTGHSLRTSIPNSERWRWGGSLTNTRSTTGTKATISQFCVSTFTNIWTMPRGPIWRNRGFVPSSTLRCFIVSSNSRDKSMLRKELLHLNSQPSWPRKSKGTFCRNLRTDLVNWRALPKLQARRPGWTSSRTTLALLSIILSWMETKSNSTGNKTISSMKVLSDSISRELISSKPKQSMKRVSKNSICWRRHTRLVMWASLNKLILKLPSHSISSNPIDWVTETMRSSRRMPCWDWTTIGLLSLGKELLLWSSSLRRLPKLQRKLLNSWDGQMRMLKLLL